jgi:hypothetical protein
MDGASDMLLITLRIDPGFHINANPASAEYLIPTNVAFAGIEPERVPTRHRWFSSRSSRTTRSMSTKAP